MLSNTINFQALSSNLISTDSGTPTQFILMNDTNTTLNLYWIDRNGVEQKYASLMPGQSQAQTTYSSHAWEIKSDDGSIGYKFYPTAPGQIDVKSASDIEFTDFSEKVTSTSQGLWSTAEGYGLINVAKSLGIVDHGYELSMNGQNNNLALNLISASSAWDAGITGKGVKVAVVDVGIAQNPEVSNSIVGGYDFYQGDTDPSPDNGAYSDHALGVASIIAGSHTQHTGQDTMGVAPDAQLLNVRVGSSQGSSSDKIALGIHWAVDNGAKVICMPLQNNAPVIDQQVADAVHYAYTHNVTTVIIGGNFSTYGSTGLSLIAKSGEAIAVGNYDALGGTLFQSSNSPGSNPFPWVVASSSGYEPNATGSYTYHSDGGTSFAGPYVAGLAALLYQQNPNATSKDIINKIIAGSVVSDSPAKAAYLSGSTSGADKFVSTHADESFDGGAGLDTLQLNGIRANYTINHNGNIFSVMDSTGKDGVDTVTNIERLVFTDKNVAIDISGDAGQVYRLYQAAFGRAPDQSGLGFWINAKDNGMSIHDIAKDFMSSTESINLYGANPSNEAMVNSVYQNVLHRAPDQAGHDFWLNAMNKGLSNVTDLVQSFADSAENVANLIGVMNNGVDYIPYHA